MTTELVHASLLEALRWISSEGATGSFKVGGRKPGSLFFDSGRLYFGMVDGQPMSGSELAEAGIDRGLWQQASTRPGARLNFVEELLAVGCDRASIRRFITHRLTTAIETMGLDAGPVEVARGRHGFGAAIAFDPAELVDLRTADPEPASIDDDSLVSLASVSPTATVTVAGDAWNLLVDLFSPARFAELRQELGTDAATRLVTNLSGNSLLTIVESHRPSDPWATTRSPEPEAPAKPSLFDPAPPERGYGPEPGFNTDATQYDDQAGAWNDDSDEYVPDKVGRQAYAAMASMRASVAEPAPQEKARALRRLIEAVKGL